MIAPGLLPRTVQQCCHCQHCLAGYTGLTREGYVLDLRQYASWCQQHHLRLFQARRADIECFTRDLEGRGCARATITRRTVTYSGQLHFS